MEDWGFENDVKMYGTQTYPSCMFPVIPFENDVKMYGTQTERAMDSHIRGLRMM